MEEDLENTCENSLSPKPQTGPRRIYPMWICPVCGTRTWITNRKRHLDTKKHKDVLYVMTERFEMK